MNSNRKQRSLGNTGVKEYELVPQEDEAKDKTRRINSCVTIIDRKSSEESENGLGVAVHDDPVLQQGARPKEFASIRSMLDKSHPRFGPMYGQDQAFVLEMKKKVWRHVKKSGEEDDGLTKEMYSAAIRRVEKEVREAYGDKLPSMRSSKFRLMMVRDGCFFLQVAFLILGKSEHLGYPVTDPIFGRKPHRKDINKWMEAMFFVGNQIPVVVLKELLKEKFFQDVIAKANLVQTQSGLCRKLLYELLASPKQNISWFDSWRTRTSCMEPQPSDLLHSLQNMLVGPDHDHIHNLEIDDDLDLEANYEQGINIQDRIFPRVANSGGENADSNDPFRNFFRAMENAYDDRRRIFPCAVDLMQSGIRIKKLKTGGIKSIRLENHYLWAILYLPALPVDDDLEILFSNLITYEVSQKIEKHSRQVSSYILFLKDIVQTTRDVKLLRKKGIIEGSSEYAEKLPVILRRLGSEDIALTPEFRRVKRMIRDYSSPWIHYRGILNFVAFLALLQTLFSLLAYFKPNP